MQSFSLKLLMIFWWFYCHWTLFLPRVFPPKNRDFSPLPLFSGSGTFFWQNALDVRTKIL